MIIEQSQHEEFERVCGGPEKAFRLMRLYENTIPIGAVWDTPQERHERKIRSFRKVAEREGYTHKQIALFLNLQ